jgi:hypothetical protein
VDEGAAERSAEPKVSVLSRQECRLLEAIALTPHLDVAHLGANDVGWGAGHLARKVDDELHPRRARTEGASRARALRSLEKRSLIVRQPGEQGAAGVRLRHFELTRAGITTINEFRRSHKLLELSRSPRRPR